VKGFKQAIAARTALPQKPLVPTAITPPDAASSSVTKAKVAQSTSTKKGPKNALKGVIVKKKKLSAPSPVTKESHADKPKDGEAATETETGGPAKRRRISSPG